jgi:hypothetical protein
MADLLPFRGKLGKLPARRFHALGTFDDYLMGRPPVPPTSVPVPSGVTWGMDGNDRLGDCVEAGSDHCIAASNAQLQISDLRPDLEQLEAQYFLETGGPDAGLDMANHLLRWRSEGLYAAPNYGPGAPNKIGAFAPLALNDPLAIQRAIAFYGFAYIGIQCPESAQQEFAQGQPWVVVKGSPIEGGHCIVLVGYDPAYWQAVTWGGIVQVSYPFISAFMDEAFAVITQEALEAGHGPGVPALDTATLLSDLDSL